MQKKKDVTAYILLADSVQLWSKPFVGRMASCSLSCLVG